MLSNLAIKDATLKLYHSFPNGYNDALKRAACTTAIIDAIQVALVGEYEAARNTIKAVHADSPPGTKDVILADKGIACSVSVKNGAVRLDKAALVPAIIKAGWSRADGTPLTKADIETLIDACSKQGKPSITITTAIGG